MSDTYQQMRQAMFEARQQMSAADSVADDMANMICGRLRKVNPYYLKKLKRELQSFNAHTGRWKEDER